MCVGNVLGQRFHQQPDVDTRAQHLILEKIFHTPKGRDENDGPWNGDGGACYSYLAKFCGSSCDCAAHCFGFGFVRACDFLSCGGDDVFRGYENGGRGVDWGCGFGCQLLTLALLPGASNAYQKKIINGFS